MKQIKIITIIACMAMQAAWPTAAAWADQDIFQRQGVLFANTDITSHEPKIVVIEEGEIPKSFEKSDRGWVSRNKWYLMGGLVIVAGAAAAAGGSGGSSSSGGSDANINVTW